MAQGNVVTPFLEMRSFVREESEVFASEAPAPALGSPFVSVYELEGHPEFLDPEQEAYSTLVQELYDQEFDEALFELMVEARGAARGAHGVERAERRRRAPAQPALQSTDPRGRSHRRRLRA